MHVWSLYSKTTSPVPCLDDPSYHPPLTSALCLSVAMWAFRFFLMASTIRIAAFASLRVSLKSSRWSSISIQQARSWWRKPVDHRMCARTGNNRNLSFQELIRIIWTCAQLPKYLHLVKKPGPEAPTSYEWFAYLATCVSFVELSSSDDSFFVLRVIISTA